MTQLLLGLDPRYIREAPYTPTTNYFPPIQARELGLNLGPQVYVYLFPSVASYVGGDIVAGVLACGMYDREELTLFIDIGTNGEIVVGNRDWLACAACSAGRTPHKPSPTTTRPRPALPQSLTEKKIKIHTDNA